MTCCVAINAKEGDCWIQLSKLCVVFDVTQMSYQPPISVYRALKVKEGRISVYRTLKVKEDKINVYRALKVNEGRISFYRVYSVIEGR